jgi:hypothetical protein
LKGQQATKNLTPEGADKAVKTLNFSLKKDRRLHGRRFSRYRI